ncbi:hypothetical protein B0H10DRAFT_2201376, partial [Mycena sp. CBHHK59/15]
PGKESELRETFLQIQGTIIVKGCRRLTRFLRQYADQLQKKLSFPLPCPCSNPNVPNTTPQGLTAAKLTTAKGAELKFWIVKANEAATKKVLNVSGKVDQLRADLACYYGLDLSVIPRPEAITVQTVDQDIRERQWADWEASGVEWKDTVRVGGVFKLIIDSTADSILSASHDAPDVLGVPPPASSSGTLLNPANNKTLSSQSLSSAATQPQHNATGHAVSDASQNQLRQVDFTSGKGSQITVNTTAPTSPQLTLPASPPNLDLPLTQSLQHEATILQDLSEAIRGLERCEGLREVIQQIESGAVQSIREHYGPTQYGRCGTADPSWPKYSNLVSKRERLHRILTNDFGGDKDRFFAFFATPPTARRKCKRTEEEPSESVPSQEHFRSFCKIVEAVPWCEADLVSKRSKIEYYSGDGEFSEALWNAKWADKNAWEVWRAIGREQYIKAKVSADST